MWYFCFCNGLWRENFRSLICHAFSDNILIAVGFNGIETRSKRVQSTIIHFESTYERCVLAPKLSVCSIIFQTNVYQHSMGSDYNTIRFYMSTEMLPFSASDFKHPRNFKKQHSNFNGTQKVDSELLLRIVIENTRQNLYKHKIYSISVKV